MTNHEYEQAEQIIHRIEAQRDEDGQLALVGYILFLLLGFTLGALLF